MKMPEKGRIFHWDWGQIRCSTVIQIHRGDFLRSERFETTFRYLNKDILMQNKQFVFTFIVCIS
jgi:hypothetical protein